MSKGAAAGVAGMGIAYLIAVPIAEVMLLAAGLVLLATVVAVAGLGFIVYFWGRLIVEAALDREWALARDLFGAPVAGVLVGFLTIKLAAFDLLVQNTERLMGFWLSLEGSWSIIPANIAIYGSACALAYGLFLMVICLLDHKQRLRLMVGYPGFIISGLIVGVMVTTYQVMHEPSSVEALPAGQLLFL